MIVSSGAPDRAPRNRSRDRILAAVCAMLIAVAAAYLIHFWTGRTRPGAVHEFKGIQYLNAGKAVLARKQWLLGVQQDPAYYGCYERLGDLNRELLHYSDAVRYYRGALKHTRGDGSLYLHLAQSERALGDMKKAAADADRARSLLPNSAEAAAEYGLAEAALQNRPAALAALRRAHQLAPKNSPYFMTMITVEFDSLEMDNAERDLQVYLRSNPGDPEAHYLLAMVYNQKLRTPANLRIALSNALQAFPTMKNQARIYPLLGRLLLDTGRTRDALRVYLAGHRLSPSEAGMLDGMGECYDRLGMKREHDQTAAELKAVIARQDRIEHLKDVTGFNHNDTAAGLELARLEEEDGNYNTALKYYAQLLHQAPKDPRTRAALAGFFNRRGRPDLARTVDRPDFVP